MKTRHHKFINLARHRIKNIKPYIRKFNTELIRQVTENNKTLKSLGRNYQVERIVIYATS